MLQELRKSTQGTAAKIVVGLIVASFSLFGIQSILVSGSGGGIAEVNGEQILGGEVQQLVNTQKRRIISQMGENMDPSLLDDQLLSSRALDSIIGRKLQTQSAADLKLRVSEQQLGMIIGSMEQFHIDGQFSADMYKSMLSGAGYTPASFKQGLAEDLLLNQLNSGLAGSDFATPMELELNAAYAAESRDVRYLTIPLEKFAVAAEISDEEIQQYYENNQQAYLSPETVDLDYIELSLDQFRQPVEESVLIENYELEKENYEYQTESAVSHILFEQQSDEDSDAFQSRIQAVQQQLAAGTEFSDLAKTASDDVGSASFGGDLGITQGDTFPPEMEDAITALEIGMVSGPVKTDAGTHLIKLTRRQDGEMPPLEEMRAELESRVQVQEARRELTLVVEKLKDVAFNAEDLSGPAEELGLEVQQIGGVSRAHPDGLFANRALQTAAFSEDVLEQGHNSDVIELASDTHVTLRVRKHTEPQVKPLEMVREDIVAQMTDQAARAAARTAAEEALVELNSGTGVESYSKQHDYDWQVELAATRSNSMVPRQLLQRIFELPGDPKQQSIFDYILTPGGDVQVFELVRVTPGALEALNAVEQNRLTQQITAEYGQLVNSEFQRGLRDNADITIL